MERIGTVALLGTELHRELSRMQRLMERLQVEREMLLTVTQVAQENARQAARRLADLKRVKDSSFPY
jgi:hypothetical protein